MPLALQAQSTTLSRAGQWFLRSGIQESSGGVARFFRSDLARNAPVSTEITGYALSAQLYLFRRTRDEQYLDAARRSAEFLTSSAWSPELRTFPFEYPHRSGSPELTYFFDCGIIVRGLLALWRETRRDSMLDIAITAGESMLADFTGDGDIHPILELPSKTPLPRSSQWSRSPGPYQLKSALAWFELAELTGEDRFRDAFITAREHALSSDASFLPAETPERTMDRLHAYCYFLEGLMPFAGEPRFHAIIRAGIDRTACYLRDIAPTFERSDVYAQLLRVRLLMAAPLLHCDGDRNGFNTGSAAHEFEKIQSFQVASANSRLDGGFEFGRKGGETLPYANPVSTAFCMQALEMWKDHAAGRPLDWHDLI